MNFGVWDTLGSWTGAQMLSHPHRPESSRTRQSQTCWVHVSKRQINQAPDLRGCPFLPLLQSGVSALPFLGKKK